MRHFTHTRQYADQGGYSDNACQNYCYRSHSNQWMQPHGDSLFHFSFLIFGQALSRVKLGMHIADRSGLPDIQVGTPIATDFPLRDREVVHVSSHAFRHASAAE
ncbi:hypothetical protein [Paraburkholderia aspalathi]|uniref:hypothetical protein n=1 Tax=Paraburkholderia aspalathi TaxID=1324617 RepID=UPI003C9FBC93